MAIFGVSSFLGHQQCLSKSIECVAFKTMYICKLVKGAHGVVKALQVAHSSFWGIWGHAPSGRS